MSDDRVIFLEFALSGVLREVRSQGLDVDELTEVVADTFFNSEPDLRAAKAVLEIEHAVDALEYPWPALG